MSILNIVNRILRGLLNRKVEVEFKLRVCLSEIEIETCCIYRYLIKEGYKRDSLAASLGKLYNFALTNQTNHLHKHNIKL